MMIKSLYQNAVNFDLEAFTSQFTTEEAELPDHRGHICSAVGPSLLVGDTF